MQENGYNLVTNSTNNFVAASCKGGYLMTPKYNEIVYMMMSLEHCWFMLARGTTPPLVHQITGD